MRVRYKKKGVWGTGDDRVKAERQGPVGRVQGAFKQEHKLGDRELWKRER